MAADGSMLSGRRILLGVAGGVAAYKAADLAGKLTGAGACVRTILTEAGEKLVTAKTFEAVTGQPVFTSLWTGPEEFRIGHIQLADWAEALVVAPATADIIAKMAAGLCDDLLSTTLCVAWARPILLAPAMNSRMWANPIVQRNLAVLHEQKVRTVGPCTGRLACGTEGVGRMAEVPQIIAALEEILNSGH
jgi:phosphopantothenoylcysteine synthetase/decarboxylase